MNVGILGSGNIAATFPETQNKTDKIRVKGICGTARSIEKTNSMAKQYGIDYVYTDYDRMLDNEYIDTVYIAVPNSLHYEKGKKLYLYDRQRLIILSEISRLLKITCSRC